MVLKRRLVQRWDIWSRCDSQKSEHWLDGAIKGSKTQDIVGLDIYRLPHGTTIADAHNVKNPNAEMWHYTPGGPEIFILIAPQDLGITGIMAWLCGEYRIQASELFQNMQKSHTKRQSEGLAT